METTLQIDIPVNWKREGLIIPRSSQGDGSDVVGDPCIVWDEEIGAWRMFLFWHPPGHGQATSLPTDGILPRAWSPVQPLTFLGPPMYTHKVYVVQYAHRPGHAARIDGYFWLVSVAVQDGHKFIWGARSPHLSGPWTWDEKPLIPVGEPGSFDEKHTDAVTGIFFPERGEVLYYYMGYPAGAQKRALSPYGSGVGAAVQSIHSASARKLGEILSPESEAGHWASGWLGGFQVLPGKSHRWVALLNASPTAPRLGDVSLTSEEPEPSLGGWAYCDEEYPIKNWRFALRPIEWIKEIPPDALANGERTNLWRHYALALQGSRIAIFYNSGYYGQEQLYAKVSY
jgi:hypothetical protein